MKFLEGITKIDITVMVKKSDDQKLKHNIKRQATLIGNTECFTRLRQDQYWININNFNANPTPNYIKLDDEIDNNLVVYTFKQVYKNKYSLVINTNQLQLYLTKDKISAKEVLDMDTNFNNIKKIFDELSDLGFELEESKSVNYIRVAKTLHLNMCEYQEAFRIIALSNRGGSINAKMDNVKISRVKKESKTTSINPAQYSTETRLQSSQGFFGAMQIKMQDNQIVVTSELKYQDLDKMAKKLKLENNNIDFEKLFTDKMYVTLLEKMTLNNIDCVFKNVHKKIDEVKSFMIDNFNKAEDREDVIATIGQTAFDERGIGYIDNLLLAESIYNSNLTSKAHFNRYTKDLLIKWHKNSDNERNAIARNTDIIEKINTISGSFGIKKYDLGLSKQTINSLNKFIKSL